MNNEIEVIRGKIEFEVKRYRELAYSCGDAWGAQHEADRYYRIAEGMEKALEFFPKKGL